MVTSEGFTLSNVDTEIRNALQRSTFGLNDTSIGQWQHNLRSNTENALSKIAQNNNFMTSNSLNNPPGNNTDGFRVTFGLQVLISYKLRFRATANVGYGKRWGNFGATSSLHFAAYNHGLGTGVGKKNFTVDITAATNLTVGGGKGTPLQSYSLNYNSPIPNKNNFKNSFSYGQFLTWNSNMNKGKFSLSDIQREGMIGFRLGDVNVSSNNDTKKFYFGDGGDRAWTGGISIATPIFEVGFQDFSGDYDDKAPLEREHKKYRDEIKKIKNDSFLSDEEKKNKIKIIEAEIVNLTNNNLHTQTSYQKNLNKASTYFRLDRNGYNATIDFVGDAWLQNAIHRAIKDFRFEYDHKGIEVWGGKNW